MIRRLTAFIALLLMTASCTLAQGEWTKTYGGNGEDSLPWMIAAGDGLLAVGHTTSTDGDLSMRTREGKAGWMLRLDGEGNTLWSCCTAHVGRSEMHRPYAHADGTFSAILTGENEGSEWLRVSEKGKVAARIEVPEPAAACAHGQAESCYGIPLDKDGQPMLALMVTHSDGASCCAVMDEAGAITHGAQAFTLLPDGTHEVCRDGSGLIAAVSPLDGSAQVLWIEPGGEKIAAPIHVPVESGKLQIVLSVLPCADGSVIFSGQLYAIGSVVMRVSAEGETLFVVDDCENLEQMALTSTGFAGVDDDEIAFYDEDGALLGSIPHEQTGWMSSMAALSDGVALMESSYETVRKPVTVTAAQSYIPAQAREYEEALYTRAFSTLSHAAADGDELVLLVEDTHSGTVCLRVSAQGQVAGEDEPAPDLPGEGVFLLPLGRLSWQETPRGAQVELRDAAGSVCFQAATPIHTAADRVQWLCAAQMSDGSYLLGGRYLTDIIANTEEKRFKREMTRDGLMQEGVVARLGGDGVLLGVKTIEDIGSIAAIAPGETDAKTLLLGARGDMTDSMLTNIVPLDQSDWAVLDIFLEPENAALLRMPDGSVLAAGTNKRNGRATVVVQPVDEFEE